MIIRGFLIACFILLASMWMIAQGPVKVSENWRVAAPGNDEFSIDTPFEFKIIGNKDAKSSRQYYGEINGTYLYVFSDPIKSPDNLIKITDFVNASGKTMLVKAAPSKPSALAFDDQDGFHHEIRAVKTASRIYVTQTISQSAHDPVALRFLGSFKVAERSMAILDETAPAPKDPNNAAINKPGPVNGQGSGSGSRSGQGSDPNGIGLGQTPLPIPGQTSALRILSKPRPGYTDLARFYQISGIVILRVPFLGSGEIGSVEVVKNLPFGLAPQAIKAARGIGFVPKYINGTPVNVTKLIEYSFLIY